LRQQEIEHLDAKEYPGSTGAGLNGYARFVSQNIQDCINAADIYLSNTESNAQEPDENLVRSLCRYIALAQHPGLVTPTSIERCMQSASAARLNSGCISRQVGAVVTNNEFSIVAFGWNDVPRGQVHCLLRCSSDLLNKKTDAEPFSQFEQKNEEFRKTLKKKEWLQKEHVNGLHVTYCFKTVYNETRKDKNQVHTRSLHAEENAFLQVVRYGGQGVSRGYLFTTASPCELCAKKAYQLGIAAIYYIDPYPGISTEHILGAGENRPELILFVGVIGRAYHELYEPIMAFKDELSTLVSSLSAGSSDAANGQAPLFAGERASTETSSQRLPPIPGDFDS
jgi:dCMP deaminase